MSAEVEPVSRWANDLSIQFWRRHHEDVPDLIIRCAGDNGRCGKELGRVWANAEGIGVIGFMHVAARRMSISIADDFPEHLQGELAARLEDRFRSRDDTQGIARGLDDSGGWVTMAEPRSEWRSIAIGCKDHDGTVDIDRERLLAALEAAALRGKRRVSVLSDNVAER